MSTTASLARTLHLVIGCTLLLAACDDGPEGPLTVLLPADAKIAIHGGDNQVAPAGSTLPQPLAVRVTTADGRAIEGVKIRWAVSASSGSVAGKDGSLTDSRGIATATRSLSGIAGRFATTATIEATGAAVSFTTVCHVQGATRMSLLPGDALIRPADTVLAALPAPLRVLIQDHEEQPVPGVTVTWSALGGTVSSGTSVTDAQGIAAMNFTRGPIVGQHTVRAAVHGLAGSPTSFTTTTLAGRPAVLEKLFGDEQAGTAMTLLASPFVVHVVDAWGNSVAGASVSWLFEAETGPAVIAQTMTATGLPGDPRPVASYSHQLGDDTGVHVISAIVTDRPDIAPVSFTFTVAPMPPVFIDVHDWDMSGYYCYYYPCGFIPSFVTVKPGELVTWTWQGHQAHDVVFEDDPATPVSSALKTTGGHARTFEVPGTYRYRCTAHSSSFTDGMVGTIVVSGPPSDATTLEKVSGDAQTGTVGSTLPYPLVVHAADPEGHSVVGVTVSWTAETDTGLTVLGQSTTTSYLAGDPRPVAHYQPTLGGAVGTQVITAAVVDRPDIAPVSFTITAEATPDTAVGVYDWDDSGSWYACWYYSYCGFVSSYVTVSVGRTVTWTWHGSQGHNVVFEDAPTEPVSSAIQTTGTHTRTFNTPGTYRYRCTLHSTSFTTGMVGMVVVL